MANQRGDRRHVGIWGGVLLATLMSGTVAVAEPELDEDMERILQSASDYLAGLASFTADFDSDLEIVRDTGMKLQLSSSGHVAVQRPGMIHASRKGPVADVEVTFDGKTMTFLGKGRNVYVQEEAEGTIEAAIDIARDDLGVDLPGADLLRSDLYETLLLEAESGEYFGTAWVNGEECHHLAVRAERVDWQLWVLAGDKPLPCKYVITSKWITGAPQYAVRLYNWNTDPTIDAAQFSFEAPAGATRMDSIEIDEAGEIVEGE